MERDKSTLPSLLLPPRFLNFRGCLVKSERQLHRRIRIGEEEHALRLEADQHRPHADQSFRESGIRDAPPIP